VHRYVICRLNVMHIKGIAAAAYSGTTKGSARIPTLLHHLLIAPRQQLTDIVHLFTGIKGLLFIIYAEHFNVASRHARRCMSTILTKPPGYMGNKIAIRKVVKSLNRKVDIHLRACLESTLKY